MELSYSSVIARSPGLSGRYGNFIKGIGFALLALATIDESNLIRDSDHSGESLDFGYSSRLAGY
jgi:hypothetical protein